MRATSVVLREHACLALTSGPRTTAETWYPDFGQVCARSYTLVSKSF